MGAHHMQLGGTQPGMRLGIGDEEDTERHSAAVAHPRRRDEPDGRGVCAEQPGVLHSVVLLAGHVIHDDDIIHAQTARLVQDAATRDHP